MQNTLIIEAGSTKTTWAFIFGQTKRIFHTKGFNPVVHHASDFEYPTIALPEQIAMIYYYGSGIIDNTSRLKVISILEEKFISAKIEVYDDSLAAARATLADEKGGIGILGTGSNSGYYDGEKVLKSIPSLGYVLGDEGGGVSIAKKLIQDYFYQRMPLAIREKFNQLYQLERASFLDNLYSHPTPNQFLASYISFLGEIDGNWKKNLLLESFRAYFDLRKHDFLRSKNNALIGSIAYYFATEVMEAAREFEINISKIIKDPIEGLIKYHSKKHDRSE